jgi:hypothetical protein
MPSSSRDAVLSFAAGALLALVVVRIVPSVLQRVACRGGACTTSVASTRTTTRLARNDTTHGGRLARSDASRDTSSARRDLGPGVYVMRAPEATAARVAPSPAPSDAAVAAPSSDAARVVVKDGESSTAAAPTADTPPDAAPAAAPAAAAPETASDTMAIAADPPPEAAAPTPPQLDVASNAVETTPPAAAPPRNHAGPATAVGSLDGWWLVTNAAESSHRRTHKGLLVVYRIELHQDGERVLGKGSTWSRNGRVLTPSQRTPVVATGTWRANRIELVLIEHASRGARHGRVEWRPTADGEAFEGRFASEATHAIGRSEAVRELSAPMDEPREEPRRSRRHARAR